MKFRVPFVVRPSDPNAESEAEPRYGDGSQLELGEVPSSEKLDELDLNKFWYRSYKIGKLRIPAYGETSAQLLMVAFVCFLGPGMFNALSGLGGGGNLDPDTANNANVALYSTFATLGFFSGSICNTIGVRYSLMFGATGYGLYSSSLLSSKLNGNQGFVIFAGFYLGICAACLWTAQATIMIAYPTMDNKGRYVSTFWSIFALGSVIGSLIPLGQNIHSDGNDANSGTYVAFMVLQFIASIVAFFMLPANKVIRADGSRVSLRKSPSFIQEMKNLGKCLITDRYIIILFPMFFASNWFYTYHFNDVNLAKFNIRTRSLNSLLYWLAQIWGSILFGFFIDMKRFNRKTRARMGWVLVFVLTMAIWGGGLAFQLEYTRAETSAADYVKIDWSDGDYIGPMFLYMFYGAYDAIWQNYTYWLMGVLSNEPAKIAMFAGFYKGIQSAGGAITWRLDSLEIPFINTFASCWGLLGGSLIIAIPVIFFMVVELEDRPTEAADAEGPEGIDGVSTDGSLEGEGAKSQDSAVPIEQPVNEKS